MKKFIVHYFWPNLKSTATAMLKIIGFFGLCMAELALCVPFGEFAFIPFLIFCAVDISIVAAYQDYKAERK